MSHSRDESRSPSPDASASPGTTCHRPRSRSRSKSLPRRSRSRSVDVSNPGNNLYVTGLSMRVTSDDLEKFFSKEGKVLECNLVKDPHTKESRGFAFITMETVEGAERCLKNLNRSVLEGRLITVEKAKRSRGRTPTPGRYQGLKEKRGGPSQERRQSRDYPPRQRYDRGHYERVPYAPDRRRRSRSPYGRRVDDHYGGRTTGHYDSYRRR
ncbi:serine/arginine-rich splicing factor SR45a-like isoform X2 [Silene latifolia]|uniref:serine/arginine-rich splicing factor SR45a-like isoform X2 n=1 Tax=Silene latifolia TaxID=37657 RepID=UPI003D786FC4